jgi:hypothetical protein
MVRKQAAVGFLVVLGLTATADAQPWSGILNPTRAVNWQRASVGVSGGIPTNYVQCGSTIAPYSGTGATITSAIAACGVGTYVLLGAGTFNLSTSVEILSQSKIILRGSGPTSTKLVFSGAGYGGAFSAPLYIGTSNQTGSDAASAQPGQGNACNWTGGYSQGATSITLASCGSTGINNGDIIVLDQLDDTTDNGGYIECAQNAAPLVCMAQNSVMGRAIPAGSNNWYSQEQFVTVISGCASACIGAGPFTLTISPGLYANNWNQGAGAGTTGAWFTKQTSTSIPMKMVGVENLTIDATSCPDDISCQSGITFWDVDNAWVKNVAILGTRRNHIWGANSTHLEIRDSYFYGTKNAEPQSYGFESFPCGDCLVEDNIFQQIASPIMFGGGMGDVVGYNFSINNVYGPATYMQSAYNSHSGGNYMNLFEGNVFNGIFTDQLHGTTGLVTNFRNWIDGLDWNTCTYSAPGCTNTNNYANHPSKQTSPGYISSFSRGYNFIGNVMGTPGYHVTYQFATPQAPTETQCSQAIWEIGYANICDTEGTGGVPDDTVVASSLMRWGNYDTVNAAVRWDATESSPGAVKFINANSTPATHNLPSSFYLPSTPSFFNVNSGATAPFPPIGPDVAGGNGGTFTSGTYNLGICQVGTSSGGATCSSSLAGHVNLIPAMNCYYNILRGPTDGSGSALAFDANNCYNGAALAAPSAPSSLTATVQ